MSIDNDGYGTLPDPDCPLCSGMGFVYVNEWAQTCGCKIEGDEMEGKEGKSVGSR